MTPPDEGGRSDKLKVPDSGSSGEKVPIRRITDVSVLLVSLAILTYAGWLLLHRESAPSEAAIMRLTDSEWARVAAGGTQLGPTGAGIKVVVFSDFQCPYCAAFVKSVAQLDPTLRAGATFEFRHLPLTSIHPYAMQAAIAAECAARQGKFAEYHDTLFRLQDSLGIKSWEAFARAVEVPDVTAFNRCVAMALTRSRIDSDLAESSHLRLRGTPTVIVEGAILPGTPGLAELSSAIRSAESAHH